MKLSQIPALDLKQTTLIQFGRLFWIEDEDTNERLLVQSVCIFDNEAKEYRWINIIIPQLMDKSGHLPFYKFVNPQQESSK